MPINIGDNRIVEDGIARITEADAQRLGGHRVQSGDIIYSRRGDVERRALVRPEQDGWLCGTGCLKVRIGRGRVDPLFAAYYLGHPQVRAWIVQHAIGATMPNLNTSIMRAVPFLIPPLPEQKAIAQILGTLDDKIEVNRRMNETLEGMARALFKSWFVDFDPVLDNALAAGNPIPEAFRDRAAQRADAATSAASQGRPFGLPKPLAAQFPNAFHDSDLGPIPEGWEVGTLGDIASNPRRSVRHEKIPEETAYIALEHMPRGSIALNEWGSADGVASNKYEFHQGEILFGKLRPYFHKVGVAPLDGVCSTDILVVVPQEASCAGYVLGIVSSSQFIDYTTATSGGTRMPRTNWKDMAAYPTPLPSSGPVSAFNTWSEETVKRIHTNIYQSKSLAALRDALLP
ncbi:MAG: restriction endonuclease subunit S, partial [Candidatus Hydrogenedentes bacterium]|nr:restriction endonuclease subunit S [Candidatus Hydrogenedentota bacterium]